MSAPFIRQERAQSKLIRNTENKLRFTGAIFTNIIITKLILGEVTK